MCRAQDSLTEIPIFQLSFVSPLFDAATRPIPVEDHFKSWILGAGFLCAVSRTTDYPSPHFWLKILSIFVALQNSPDRSEVCNCSCAARSRKDCPRKGGTSDLYPCSFQHSPRIHGSQTKTAENESAKKDRK